MGRLSLFLLTLLSGTSIGVAFLLPNSISAVFLGWVAALSLAALLLLSPRPYLHAYLCGLISNAIGFYWLTHTISFFGGFDSPTTALIFLLFITISALQHIIAVFFYRALPRSLDYFSLRIALAWVSSEFISVRIFPWHYGHTQLAFLPFVQIADIGSALLVTLLLIMVAESIVRAAFMHERSRTLLIPIVAFVLTLIYGTVRIAHFSDIKTPLQSVALIQGNVSLEEKHDQKFIKANKQRYLELSEKHREDGRLIIWPESVITDWIDTDLRSVFRDPRLPRMSGDAPMLIGALTTDFSGGNYNSALAIMGDGTIAVPYHKQILMPFGEYVPFGKMFPWLKEAAHVLGDFTPGTEVRVFDYQIESAEGTRALLASPLICYEDIVRGLARDAVLQGANLLINISNDAWFGQSAAPYQHHLLAAFRAIENRRYLVRATNTGYSAIVDPVGRTVNDAPIFEETVIVANVVPIQEKSIYTEYIGDKLWWLLLVFCLGSAAYRRGL